MLRFSLMVIVLSQMLSVSGCASGEFDANNEHCSAWYIAKRPLTDQRLDLQQACLVGYYSSVPEPVAKPSASVRL